MRKTSVFFALCLALVLTLISCGGKVYTTGSGGGVSLDPVFKLTRDKIFLVGSEATGYQGTAFLVKYKGQRYLVTNFHVVSLLKDVFIETENNVSFKGVKVLAVNRNLDLAVLEAKNLPESLEGLSYSHDYSTSQKIFVVGYPDMRSKENHLNFVTGVISDANYLAPYYMGKGETRNIQITAPINPGNSGSPLLNEHGDAIGVIAWYYADKQAGNYAVPFSDVTNMFREIENRTADVKQIYHAGAACYSDDECQWLYFCIEGRCQELKDLGHNCKKNEDCYLPYNCFNGVCSRTGTTGDVCQNDSQCSPPSYCILGTCRPLSKKGEACKIDEDCVNPLYCILGKCVTSLSNLNEPCGQTIDCVKPYTCSGGVCKNVSGTYCNSDYQCSPQFCILGTCRDLGKYGDPCGKTIDCQSGLKCGNGKCEALSGLGGYCSADIDCVLPYYCAGGRCAEGGGSQGSHVGTYCTSDSQCTPPLYCILNSCRPLAQVGEACKYDEDCVNPLFCITGKCVTE
ncbi:MAG: trypsin-like peptidase domain-containing protein, partial [Deltaproteobacteria bacterium]|nr:trypsin-like peptidase domain-containing protein [Deltaproteobacteria bacterium]